MLACDLRKKIRYIQHDTDTDDIRELDFMRVDKTGTCEWYLDNFDYNDYNTGCGSMFTFNERSVKDNRFKYCPYCGKEVTEEEKELNND